jgi:hypothetical protein
MAEGTADGRALGDNVRVVDGEVDFDGFLEGRYVNQNDMSSS